SSRGAGGRRGDEAARETGEEVDAREPGPLVVGREQVRRLPRLDLVPAAGGTEGLHEAEVADESVLAAAQPFEPDDSGGPWSEAAFVVDPGDDGLRRDVVEAFELETAAEADERRASAFVEPEPPQLERRERSERGGLRRFE